ncbi:hypothetical protein [Bdellovibrio reynosensis]|uniref:Uncharacterized protein n=1 Tax=Bdellovibrio reynosensis TaxID=2835041 RepID=A0ABY4CC25_9BACT|nr:hypothetical protein [Bdellovibrio reynosensis]UOF02526.1 hypothetical protein MNR06_06120 [Bdellovibrio reynosensis]
MKTIIVSVMSLLVTVAANARPAPAVYATCEGTLNDGTPVALVVREMAIKTVQQGLYTVGEGAEASTLSLICETVTGERTPDKSPVYQCTENRNGEGKVLVTLERGVTGLVIGQIQREQMFPLKPVSIGSLLCK